MKVDNISSAMFRAYMPVTRPDGTKVNNSNFKPEVANVPSGITVRSNDRTPEIINITPDYNIKLPQRYSKIGVSKTNNGLTIHSYKLANGHRVTIIPMEGSPATVKNYVNVGSMNETDDIKGISHFLEHMAFNGTKGTDGYMKLNRGDSFKKIDEMGGWTNASTNYALTDYVNSTPMLDDKDLEQQIKVIASMTEDLALTPEMIEKEKNPVSSEIDMILDRPETIAIDHTVRTLFGIKSSADELVGGSVSHIQNLTREKVLDYYNKYYTPDNMHLVITGDVDPQEAIDLVSRNFHSTRMSQGRRYEEKLNPINNAVRKDFMSDKAVSATAVLGFAGPKTSDVKNNIITEIISKYLLSTDAGISKEFKRLNVNSDFGTEKISTNPNNPTLTYIGYECSDENSEETLKMLFDKLTSLKAPNNKALQSIKKSLLMEFNNKLEYSSDVNNLAGNSLFNGDMEYLTNYENVLNEITTDDINKYIKQYLNPSKAAITIVHPKVTEAELYKNYNKAQGLCFMGKSNRVPLNLNNVSRTTLGNNYEVAMVNTKNDNVTYNLNLYYDIPEGINPAAKEVLSVIYAKGPKRTTEEQFLNYLEKNSSGIGVSVGRSNLSMQVISPADGFSKSADIAAELMYQPKITEKELADAKVKLRDILSRMPDTSSNLYTDYESKNNPYYSSKEATLKNLETLTIDDVKALHNYIMNNSKGTVSVNIPENHSEIRDKATEKFSSLNNVKPYEFKLQQVYKPNEAPVVLTKSRNVSQADIRQVFKFKTDNSPKEDVTGLLLNSILSSSNSIGLFNSLREQDHLAYSVHSYLNKTGDCGEISLNILTSTDNKDTGETSYDNVQKSIYGFNRQITKLLNSEYTDEDLETAKRTLKASMLNNEGVGAKLDMAEAGMYYGEDSDYVNKKYKLIDSITREDIDRLAQRVFFNLPVYSIVASQDTLDYNKAYLDRLSA